jgi:TRAP-type C4-dicarboxylate transport system permease small subunit
MSGVLSWLHRRAENLLVLAITAMFVAFLLQIVFRYFMNLPVAWTEEVCVMAWVWGILWGSAFVTRDEEEIRFDMVYGHVKPRTRRIFRAVAGTVFVIVMLIALPATWGYVRFMKVESSAALGIPMSWVFSVYLIFAVAMIMRHALIVWQSIRGIDPQHAS